jgi:hypothetical protein
MDQNPRPYLFPSGPAVNSARPVGVSRYNSLINASRGKRLTKRSGDRDRPTVSSCGEEIGRDEEKLHEIPMALTY